MSTSDNSGRRQNLVEKKVRELCYDLTFERYGADISPPIVDRLEYELDVIAENNYCAVYLIAYWLTNECRQKCVPFITKGNSGSSMLAFVLGITHVNPMPMHYYCPGCGYTDFNIGKYHSGSARYGTDLRKAVCPECGEEMTGDGFDIPFEMFSGINGREIPNFYFGVPDENYNDLCEICCAASERWRYDGNIMLFTSPLMRLLQRLQYAAIVGEDCIPLDVKSICEVLKTFDHKSIPYLHYPFACVSFDLKPDSISEIMQQLGFAYTCFYNDNEAHDLPFCDDIFETLMCYGLTRKTAWRITSIVKQDKLRLTKNDIENLRKADVPEDLIAYLTSIRSICPRADIAEFSVLLYKLMWYQKYFPKEYEREFKAYKTPVSKL